VIGRTGHRRRRGRSRHRSLPRRSGARLRNTWIRAWAARPWARCLPLGRSCIRLHSQDRPGRARIAWWQPRITRQLHGRTGWDGLDMRMSATRNSRQTRTIRRRCSFRLHAVQPWTLRTPSSRYVPTTTSSRPSSCAVAVSGPSCRPVVAPGIGSCGPSRVAIPSAARRAWRATGVTPRSPRAH